MSGLELLAKLKENFSPEDIGSEEFPALVKTLKKEKGIDLGEVELVEEVGGYEGAGDHCHFVFEFKTLGIFIKIEGFYSSYSGSSYEDMPFEVIPIIKPIVHYESI